MGTLYYQGHNSMRLTTGAGTVVYIDPFAGDGYQEPADLILVSHQHNDHNQVHLPAQKPDCRILQSFDLLRLGNYLAVTIKDVRVEAVPAYNKNHNRDECVGFLLTADNTLLYFACDTSRVREMEALAQRHIDCAFLPTDGVYNMDVEEAAQCAQIIGAKYSIPVHTIPGQPFSSQVAARFSSLVPNALVLHPGEELFF